MSEIVWQTPIGRLRTIIGKQGVRRLEFAPPSKTYPVADGPVRIARRNDESIPESERRLVNRHVERLGDFLKAYFEGGNTATPPLLDLADVSEFDQIVLGACAKIGFGRTKSYGELARAVGRPNAARAIGGAMARNPIPLLVPCHRVVATGSGRLGGFSGGLPLKQWLLAHEAQIRTK